MIDSTNPRVMADNIRKLSGNQIGQAAELEALDNKIEALGSYSTTEIDTGKKWVDGSSIFRKVFILESAMSVVTGDVTHTGLNISDSDILVFAAAISSSKGYFPLFAFKNTGVLSGELDVISFRNTNTNCSGFIIEYTKAATPDVLPSPGSDTRSIEPEEIPEDEYIEPEVIEEAPEEEPIEEPIQEVKKTTRKKSTN